MDDQSLVVTLDFGGDNVKLGFAGEEEPIKRCENFLAKVVKYFVGMSPRDTYSVEEFSSPSFCV